jgi:basic amino acid/polyamine antiporter, APA family
MTANVVNCIVASGIFVLPASVALILGPEWLIAYLICALVITLVFLSLAEAASRVSETGGPYRFVEVAFGPYAGVILGAVIWFSAVASSAAVVNIFAGTLATVVPAFGTTFGRVALIVATYAVLTAINIRGVRAGALVVELVTLAKILPLIILVAVGLFALRGQHVPVSGHAPIGTVGRASLELFFAFTGIEVALTPAGEVANPSRTMPRAVLLALAIVTALYISVHYVAQGVLGPGLAANQLSPLADTASHLFGASGKALMLAAAALSTFAYVSGDILASPRIMFAFGQDGYLPAIMGTVHSRHRTPHVAIIAYAVVTCALAIYGTFPILAALSAIAALIIYLGSCLALLVLRRRDVRTHGQPFLLPGGPTIPLLACAVVIWLLAQGTRDELLAMVLVIVIASVLYLARSKRHVARGSQALE